MFRRIFLLVALTLSAAANAAPSVFEPREFEYDILRGSLTLGVATFELSPTDLARCHRYTYSAQPRGIARLFVGELQERSLFCVEDGVVRSRSFVFTRTDRSKEDFSLVFDWPEKRVESSTGDVFVLDHDMYDRLASQLVVQQWVIEHAGDPPGATFTIDLVDDDKIKTYRFEVIETGRVEVPAGDFETVRVDRVDGLPKKSTQFWLAPALGYQIVQVVQIKKGDEQFRMVLAKARH